MWTEILLIIILLLLVSFLGVSYYYLKYQSFFLNQIRTIKGIEVRTLENGKSAPLFRTFGENGEKVVLKELFGSHNTLILFIKTTCPVCKSMLPDLIKIQNNFGLNFLVINSDNSDDDIEITSQLNTSITYVRAPHIAQSYFLSSYPYGVLINKEGKVALHSKLNNFNSLLNMLINEELKEA